MRSPAPLIAAPARRCRQAAYRVRRRGLHARRLRRAAPLLLLVLIVTLPGQVRVTAAYAQTGAASTRTDDARTDYARGGYAQAEYAQTENAQADTIQATPPGDAAAPPAAGAAQAASGFDRALAVSVLDAGLHFMLPRILEPQTPGQLTQWGLNGLTALDPGLLVSVSGATLRLSQGGSILFSATVPAAGDVEGWTRAAAAMADAGWSASAAMRAAGQQGVIQAFFDELFNHLDPYSRYIPPAPADAERTHRTGGVASTGLGLADGDRYPVVSDVNANGPSWAAGVDTGWQLMEVDGHSTRGQNAATVAGWMRGSPGTPVALVLRNPHQRAPRSITVTRAAVPPETVFAFRNDNILILRITGFAADTAQEVSEFLDEATGGATDPHPDAHTKLRGLIIDLRGNRGGVLQQAVTTVALMLNHGVAIITRGRDPEANHVWGVRGGDLTDGAPIVILVDGRTASAAEVMSAAMSDQRRAVVIGSATLGKGLVQTIGQMPDGGELFVTWSRMLAPQGWPLQGLGVLPQVCTSQGAAALGTQMHALAGGRNLLHDDLADWRAARAPLPESRVLDLRGACPAAVGTDADLEAARTLIDHPAQWRAALIAAPDPSAILPN